MIFDPYGYDRARSARKRQQATDLLAAKALLAVPLEARETLWRGLRAAVEGTLDLYERTPSAACACGNRVPAFSPAGAGARAVGSKRQPPAFTIQHVGQPCFDPAALRYQTLEGWHHLTGLELRLAAQVLEALIQTDTPTHRDMLGEQCARVGQLYSELKRRAGQDIALAVLRGELRLLRYRNSPIVGPLIYN